MHQLPRLKDRENLIHGFSSRSDGNMSFRWGSEEEVLRNREAFLKKINLTIGDCISLRLDHGEDIVLVERSSCGEGMKSYGGIKTDALITKERGVFLFLLTADCLPIIFYDPVVKVLSLAHLGWKNADKRFTEKIVKVLVNQHGADPKNLLVGIGPGIHKESYIFTKPVNKEFTTDWGGFLIDLPENKLAIDIVGYNRKQLLESGVPPENIEISDIDTAQSQDFFSYYREVRTGEPQGRFATIVGME